MFASIWLKYEWYGFFYENICQYNLIVYDLNWNNTVQLDQRNSFDRVWIISLSLTSASKEEWTDCESSSWWTVHVSCFMHCQYCAEISCGNCGNSFNNTASNNCEKMFAC